MYRPAFSVVGVNQVGVEMSAKALSSGQAIGPTVCEDGHPYVLEPMTGRKICTCNLGPEMHFDPRLLLSDARKQGMALSGSIGGSSLGLDASAFYSPFIRGMPGRQDVLQTYVTSSLPAAMTFDPTLANHPYGLLYAGLDVNGGPIRKAATRETTGPLKVWLSEHKKNPYPTKAEKIMLAIITRMTLTQVSTWFANARRRLKKENKLYSTDRDNRDDDDLTEDDFSDSQRAGKRSHSEGLERRAESDSDNEDINVDLSDCCDSDEDVRSASSDTRLGSASSSLTDVHVLPESAHCTRSRLGSELFGRVPDGPIPQRAGTTCSSRPPPSIPGCNKPKIWSISEIMSGKRPRKESETQSFRPASMTRHASMNPSQDLPLTSPPLATSQTYSALSVAIPSSPKPSSPCSSSMSSSSSSTSPTAFRPFTSAMIMPSFFQPRPGAAGMVNRQGQAAGQSYPPTIPAVSPARTLILGPPRGIASKDLASRPQGFNIASRKHLEPGPTTERPGRDTSDSRQNASLHTTTNSSRQSLAITTTTQPQNKKNQTTTQPQHNHKTTTTQPQHNHITTTSKPQHNHNTSQMTSLDPTEIPPSESNNVLGQV